MTPDAESGEEGDDKEDEIGDENGSTEDTADCGVTLKPVEAREAEQGRAEQLCEPGGRRLRRPPTYARSSDGAKVRPIPGRKYAPAVMSRRGLSFTGDR
jgi:hypothetical protein